MAGFGKLLIFFGAVLVLLGLALFILGRSNLPLGRLPGDLIYRGKKTTVYFPLMSSILVSVFLSLVLYVISKMKH